MLFLIKDRELQFKADTEHQRYIPDVEAPRPAPPQGKCKDVVLDATAIPSQSEAFIEAPSSIRHSNGKCRRRF